MFLRFNPKRIYTTKKYVIGIAREFKNNERRACLTPKQIKELTNLNHKVIVQRSALRIFKDSMYEQNGALLVDSFTDHKDEIDVIIGVKEADPSSFLTNKTYMMFSHTHKGQIQNKPMLKEILNKKIRLIDYELLTKNNKRLVMFGFYAGLAGMVNIFSGMGVQLLKRGYSTPFLYLGLTHQYKNYNEINNRLKSIELEIKNTGFDTEMHPLVICVLGSGNVVDGCMEIIKKLPHEFITANDLQNLRSNGKRDRVYVLKLAPIDYILNKDDTNIDYTEYRHNPVKNKYKSTFSTRILPFVSVVVNGVYWDNNYPKLIPNNALSNIKIENSTLLSIGDISCDIDGSIELTKTINTIDVPFTYIKTNSCDVQLMAIDNLPTQLPLESSEHFGGLLIKLLKKALIDKFDNEVMNNATIAKNGELNIKYKHLLSDHKLKVCDNEYKDVLLFGAGMVAVPFVEYVLRDQNIRLTVASAVLEDAKKLKDKFATDKHRIKCVQIDVSIDYDKANDLIKNHIIAVSFVPANLHHIIANLCITNKKHMVTASYVSDDMMKLNQSALKADVTILNEIGLDPGIDHLSAKKIIDNAKMNNKSIVSFISWCGGLPAPEFSDNPIGYKFSWSPKGVLTASLNKAKFKMNNKIYNINGDNLLKHKFGNVPILPGFNFEGLPNRDSMLYKKVYELDKDTLKTMFRGTLRYKGYSDIMNGFNQLNMFDTTKNKTKLNNNSQFLKHLLNLENNDVINDKLIAKKLNLKFANDTQLANKVLDAIKYFEMTSASNKISKDTNIDILCEILLNKLTLKPHERDMIAMHHEFITKDAKNNNNEERITSTLIVYGDNNYSAMAKTVGYPAAIAAKLIMDNIIKKRGVLRPVNQSVYDPILRFLEMENIVFKESASNTQSMSNSLLNSFKY